MLHHTQQWTDWIYLLPIDLIPTHEGSNRAVVVKLWPCREKGRVQALLDWVSSASKLQKY